MLQAKHVSITERWSAAAAQILRCAAVGSWLTDSY